MSFTTPAFILLHLGAFAFLVSLAFSGFMISAGLMDKPVDRSNHKDITPTAGGMGMVAGMGAALLALSMYYPVLGDHGLLAGVAALGLGIALLGLLDDIYNVRALMKFFMMVIIAGAAVSLAGVPSALPLSSVKIGIPVWFGFSGAVLWIFVTVNAVNFVDGSNGLMGGYMTVAFAFLALIAVLTGAENTALLATICAASICGFLPYNWRTKAYIFCGDVGALLVGFCYGVASLLLVSETGHAGLLYVGPLLVLPLLTDVLLTLLFRWRRKEKLMVAHSDHIYQRLIRSGRGHTYVAWLYVFAALAAGMSSSIGINSGLIQSLFYLALWTTLWSILYLLLYRKLSS